MMNTLPEYDWFEYESPSDAIGIERDLRLDGWDGVFTIPSTASFSEFLTDLTSGNSIHSERFSYEDALGFITSQWNEFFVERGSYVLRDSDKEEEGYFKDWRCGDGDDPDTIIYVGNENITNSIARLRPVDIMDIWVRSPHLLDFIFPSYNESGFYQQTGYEGNIHMTSAICVDCGKKYGGWVRTYTVYGMPFYDFSNGMTPFLLSYIKFANNRENVTESLRSASKAGVPLSVITEYFEAEEFTKHSAAKITDETVSQYRDVVDRGWSGSDALTVSIVSAWFEESDREGVLAALRRYTSAGEGSNGQLQNILDVFQKHDNKNAGILIRSLDENLDSSLIESLMISY